ncbi:MAG: hypothetical protein R2837_08680 [Aliarcobacter sp.]
MKLYKATHEFDEGCIQYDLHVKIYDEDSFTFVENLEKSRVIIFT